MSSYDRRFPQSFRSLQRFSDGEFWKYITYFVITNLRCGILIKDLIKDLRYFVIFLETLLQKRKERLHRSTLALPSSLTIDRCRPLTTIPYRSNGFLARSGGDGADARRVVFNRVTSASVNRCLLRTILGVVE